MSHLPAQRPPDDPAALDRRREAQAVLDGLHGMLDHPVLAHRAALSVLARVMTDESVPARERRRAAEAVLRFELEVRRRLADLLCVKEQVLDGLGIAPPPAAGAQAVAVAQAVTRIEIVRSDDWRDGERPQG